MAKPSWRRLNRSGDDPRLERNLGAREGRTRPHAVHGVLERVAGPVVQARPEDRKGLLGKRAGR